MRCKYIIIIIFTFLINSLGFAEEVIDMEEPPKTRIKLSDTLSYGAKAELEIDLEGNFNLNANSAEDEKYFLPLFSTSLSYKPNKKFDVFATADFHGRIISDQDTPPKDSKTILEVKQLFASLNDLVGGLDVRLGRQRLKDEREWLYDEEMDAFRLVYGLRSFALEVFYSEFNNRDLLNNEPDEDVGNLLASIKYNFAKNSHVKLYRFARDNKIQTAVEDIYYGISVFSENFDKIKYWGEFANLKGNDGVNDRNGFGFDIGGTWELDHDLKPSITIGYASGTGDDNPGDNENTEFHQPLIQDNNAKLNGIARLKYYGEMVEPNLSNLKVLYMGAGIRPSKIVSVDVVYHTYQQDVAAASLYDSNIDDAPNGTDTDIGSALDFVVGYKSRNKSIKVVGVLGIFSPGSAFGNAENATYVEFKARYDFGR